MQSVLKGHSRLAYASITALAAGLIVILIAGFVPVFFIERQAQAAVVGIDFLVNKNGSWPSTANSGNTVTLNVTVVNGGTVGVSGSILVTLYVNGASRQNQTIVGLASNASKNLTFTYTASCGSNSVEVYADDDNAYDEAIESNNSTSGTVTVNVLCPPSSFSGSAVSGSSSKINWNWSSVTGATSYTIYTTSGTPIQSGLTGTSWIEQGLTKSTSYSRQIATCNANGCGPRSSTASATTNAMTTPTIGFPEDFTSSSGQINWHFSYPDDKTQVEFLVQVNKNTSYDYESGWLGVGPDSNTQVTCNGNDCNWKDVRSRPCGNYWVAHVKAHDKNNTSNESGYSSWSDQVSESLPGTPGNPTYSSIQTDRVTVSWTSASGATSYNLQRCTGSSCSPTLLTSGVTSPRTDTGLSCNTTYTYSIEARNNCSNGAFSGSTTVTTSACPLPDLTISDSPWISGSLCANTSHTLSADVRNQGSNVANGSFKVQFEFAGSSRCNQTLSVSMVPGDIENFSCSYTPPSSGSQTIYAIADKDSQVTESNESNNQSPNTSVNFLPDCPDDGWYDTSARQWVFDVALNACQDREKEQKMQENRDYPACATSCTYSVTTTRWVDTGATRTVNKTNGTSCNADSNGCTQNDSCQNGTCTAGSSPNCSDGNDCTNDSCTSTGSTTYSCTRTNLADGSTCSGTPGRCCTGACDSDGTTNNSWYDTACRAGPSCQGSGNWAYSAANSGSACGSASNYCANTATCDTRQQKNTCASGSCTGAATDVGDTSGTSCAGQTCAPYSDTCLATPGRLRDYAGTNGTCSSSSETCTAPSYTDSCVVGQCSATCNSSSSSSWSGTACQYNCNTGSTCTYASSCTTRCSAGSSYCVSGGRCYSSVGCSSSGCTETDQGAQPANNYSSGGTCFWGCSVSCTSSGWSRTGCSSGTIDDGLSCTTDSCTSTGVTHTYLAGYPKCTANNQCDDTNSNTQDLCQTPGVCSGSCQNISCTADGWYNTGSAYCVNNGDANQCQYARKQVQDQEYRDYSSVNGAACTSTVTSTRTVDTGSSCTPVNKPNGTSCDDGLYCNLGESCTNGVCGGGSARSCPAGSCQTASCNESTDQCTTSPFTACVNNDGQCCGSCTSANDNDCANNPPDVPAIPNGSSSGVPGTPYSYLTSGSDPDGNNPVTFRFDWGDGNISGYGSATQSHSWGATGTYQVRARSRDSLLMESVAWSGTMTVTIAPPADTTNPTVSSPQARPDSYNDSGAWDNDTTIFFTFSASDAGGSGLSDCFAEIGVNPPVTSVGTSGQATDTGSEGLNIFYVRCRDGAGNYSTPVQSDTISIDTNAPSLSSPAYLTVEGTTCSGASCPATAPTITAGDPDISWNTSDTGSGLQQVEVWRGNGACPTTTWDPSNPVFTTTSALSSGSWTDMGRGNGDYCYGLHVKDNVNNCRNENGTLCGGSGSVQTARGPITVTINRTTPDFSVSFSAPTTATVTQGTNATFSIAISPSGGFTSSVGTWTVASCPSGAVCSVAPASCTSASYASCGTLTITTGSVTPGPYSGITVTGIGGSLTRTSTNSVSVTVNFNDTTAPTVSFVPANRSWANTDASVTVTAADSSGISFTRHCWTTSASCDPGTTAANTFTNGSSLTQSSDGSWNLCIRARDNSANQNWNATPVCSGTYQIDKNYPSIDSLSVSESTNPGNFVSYPSSLTITSGDPVIDWTASDTGGSSLQQTEVWRANKSCATVLPADWNQVTIDSSTPAAGPYPHTGLGNGTYCFGIHAKDTAQNCLTEDAKDCLTSAVVSDRTVRGPITVTINRSTPDFSVSFSAPTTATVTQGTNATFSIAISPSGGFTSSVGTWTVASCPSGAVCSVAPASCTSASYASCGTLTITTGSVTPGPYSGITVTGIGGSLTRTSTNSVSVTVTTGANQPPNKPILIPPQ